MTENNNGKWVILGHGAMILGDVALILGDASMNFGSFVHRIKTFSVTEDFPNSGYRSVIDCYF